MKDCNVLHNHLEGSSFSLEDISAIITHNAKQLTVYSRDYIYVVKRPEVGWGFEFGVDENGFVISDAETLALFEEAKSTIDDMLFKALKRGEINHNQKELEENHYIWSIFFKSKNIYYERIKN